MFLWVFQWCFNGALMSFEGCFMWVHMGFNRFKDILKDVSKVF